MHNPCHNQIVNLHYFKERPKGGKKKNTHTHTHTQLASIGLWKFSHCTINHNWYH
jgi:hypothetical protein